MRFIKKIIAALFFVLLFFCSVGFSDFGGAMDNSKKLHTFLEKHAKNLDSAYVFKVHKEKNYYNVIIKFQDKEHIKKIPQRYVDELFERNSKNSEKTILNIIFIPGKE